ncbi:gliding motility-associated protein GldE [Chitinophaga tropicalis]|uniref:Gliding motility-associated protein GldE n=1 Tax=Chitinophaga tropicalis TaxID=2683588 RepID=A0A7K1TZ34_9BACT|nr:gliding motility-associated protein GldE [Chitinophaga tropicalis]MVT07310.1 gliding motility-associated protein GldE [Chitinophaga tropicalis]
MQAATPIATPNVVIYLLVIFILLLMAFIVSGAEVAFFSLNYKDLNALKTRQNTSGKLITKLLEKPRSLLASLQIAGILLSLAFILVTSYLITQMEDLQTLPVVSFVVRIAIIVFLLLFGGQVLPRVWAAQNNIRFATYFAWFVSIIHATLEPISDFYVSISESIEGRFFHKGSAVNYQEIDEAIEMSVDPAASQEEKNILKGILKFGNITVKQIMHTRLDVSGIEYDADFDAIVKRVADLHYSRLPVYKGNLDNIVGVIHTKDLLPHLNKGKAFDWHTVMRQPFFVHGHKLIEDLLSEFQTRRMHFAVVVDEFGGTSGIVTLEDIVEEVIGDIKDEFDEEEFHYSKVDNNTYVFEGKTMLNDVCRIMNIPPDTFEVVKGESDSIGGLILELAGKFPEENSVISHDNYDFTILEVSKMRIQKVQVAIRQNVEEEN